MSPSEIFPGEIGPGDIFPKIIPPLPRTLEMRSMLCLPLCLSGLDLAQHMHNTGTGHVRSPPHDQEEAPTPQFSDDDAAFHIGATQLDAPASLSTRTATEDTMQLDVERMVAREQGAKTKFSIQFQTIMDLMISHSEDPASDWSSLTVLVRLFVYCCLSCLCVVLCCVVVCCVVVLLCSFPQCAALVFLFCVLLHCDVLRCAASRCILLCCAVACCVVLCCVVSCCVVSRCVMCVVLCCVVSCRVVSFRVVLCRVVSCRVVCVLLCSVVWCAEGAVTRRQWPGCLPTGTGKRAGLCVWRARCV